MQLAERPLRPLSTVAVTWDVAIPPLAKLGDDEEERGTVSRPGENDWVGLYKSGTPTDFHSLQGEHLTVVYVDAQLGGTVRIRLPSMPGRYTCRYVHESGAMLAESQVLEVVAHGQEEQADKQPSKAVADGVAKVHLLSKQEVTQGSVAPGPGQQHHAPPVDGAQPQPAPRMDTQEAALQPPYLLEKLPRISTYTLSIPMPWWIRIGGKSTHSPPGGSTSTRSDRVYELPQTWQPGVRILGDSAAALSQGEKPGIEVVFELPALVPAACDGVSPVSRVLSAYDEDEAARTTVKAFLDSKTASQNFSTIAKQSYRLHVELAHRIEGQSCGAKLFTDHVALRLPLYYTGSALPDRPASLITGDETLSLRRQGRNLSCRACGQPLMRPLHATSDRGTGAATAPVGMKAYLLPSDHWLEWSEFWMCHETGPNLFIPETDFGARRGVLLLGETTILVHPVDVCPEAVSLIPAMDGQAQLEPPHGQGNGTSDEIDLPESPSIERCCVYCTRCFVPVGTGTYSTSRAQSSAEAALAVGQAAESLPEKLTPDVHLTLHLYKDRLSVPLDAAPRPKHSTASTGTPLVGHAKNALAHYAVSSRLASRLYSSTLTRSQYRFMLIDSEAYSSCVEQQLEQRTGTGTGDSADVNTVLALTAATRAVITLLNWNASVRASVGGKDGVSAALRPFCCSRDMPVLQLQYAGAKGGGEADDWAKSVQRWAAGNVQPEGEHEHDDEEEDSMPPPEPVPMLPEEIAEIICVLHASTSLRPPSARALTALAGPKSRSGHLHFQLGYLPFWADIPSDT